jgi:hypothetical protein
LPALATALTGRLSAALVTRALVVTALLWA